jgi:hypothetical protein
MIRQLCSPHLHRVLLRAFHSAHFPCVSPFHDVFSHIFSFQSSHYAVSLHPSLLILYINRALIFLWKSHSKSL